MGSAVRIAKRWKDHRWGLAKHTHANRLLQRAWDKYGADSFVFEVLEYLSDPTQLVARENYWIQELSASCRGRGYNLCPVAGSMLGFKFLPESRQKMSRAARGKVKSPEHQAKITAALKGRRLSEECKAAMSIARKGTRATEAQRARMRLAQQSRTISPEARARMVAANVGRKFTQEHRDRISRALRGKITSEATKEKLRAAARAGYLLKEKLHVAHP